MDLNFIQVLIFEKDKQTTSLKGAHYPQLIPIDGSVKTDVDEVICRQLGFDGQDLLWKCRTPLDEQYKFSEARVSCEGWSGPGDHMIVPGSCLVEYKIDYVSNATFGEVVLTLIIIAAIVTLIAMCCCNNNRKCDCAPQAPVNNGMYAPKTVFVNHVYRPVNTYEKKEDSQKKEKRETTIAKTTTR